MAFTQAMPAGMSRLDIGRNVNGTQMLNGTVRRLRYWPRRLSDTELRAITA